MSGNESSQNDLFNEWVNAESLTNKISSTGNFNELGVPYP